MTDGFIEKMYVTGMSALLTAMRAGGKIKFLRWGKKKMRYDDLISRQDTINDLQTYADMAFDNRAWMECIDIVEREFTAEIDIQVHLCDSCKYTFPDCKATMNDILFGNGEGNDNICACNIYSPAEKVVGEIRIDIDEIMERIEREWYKPNEWIPCSEQLPKVDGDYLVTYDKGYAEDYGFDLIGIAPFEVDCEGFGIWQEYFDQSTLGSLGSDWVDIKVIAWMPLPEPYKGGDDDD